MDKMTLADWAILDEKIRPKKVSRTRHIMEHNILFGSMMSGTPAHIVGANGQWILGTVQMIEMESGPRDGYTPYRWNVRVISDDDVVEMFVVTREMRLS